MAFRNKFYRCKVLRAMVLSIAICAPAHLISRAALAHPIAHTYAILKKLGEPDPDKALQKGAELAKKNASDLQARWLVAEAIQFKNAQAAETHFIQLLNEAKKQRASSKLLADIYGELGLCQFANGRSKDAIETINMALKMDSGSSKAHYLKALMHTWNGKEKEAVSEFDKYNSISLEADGYIAKAHYFEDLGKRKEALAILKEAEKKFPSSPLPDLERAFMYLKSEDAVNAEKEADTAESKASLPSGIYTQIAALYKKQANIEKYLETQKKAALHSSKPKDYIDLAWTLLQRNKIDESIKVLERGHSRFPDNEEFIDRKMKVQRIAGRWKDSLATAQYSLKKYGSSQFQGHIGSGLAYEALHDYRKAIEEFDKAFPGRTSMREIINRGQCHLILKNYQKARNDANIWLDKHPKHLAALDLRARANLGMGKFKEALIDADVLVASTRHNPNYLKLRGEILQKLDRASEAAEDFAKAAKLKAVYELHEEKN